MTVGKRHVPAVRVAIENCFVEKSNGVVDAPANEARRRSNSAGTVRQSGKPRMQTRLQGCRRPFQCRIKRSIDVHFGPGLVTHVPYPLCVNAKIWGNRSGGETPTSLEPVNARACRVL